MTEKEIEYQILHYLRSLGIFCFKVDRQGTFDPTKKIFRSNKNPFKKKGVSDILGICNKRFLAIEVKRNKPKGYPSKEQKEFIEEVNLSGGIAFIARSVDDVKSVLSTIATG